MSEPDESAQRFDLFTTDGEARFVWTNRDRGVALESDAIAVMRAGQWTRGSYERIVSVTLNTAAVGRSAPIAQCIIRLFNGSRIIVSTANERGLADPLRNRDFRDFVVSLHQKLVATGAAGSISFNSGFSRARMNGLVASLVAGGLLFVVLPLVLLLLTGEMKALFLLVAGAALIWPSIRIARNNQPATYSPNQPPDLTG